MDIYSFALALAMAAVTLSVVVAAFGSRRGPGSAEAGERTRQVATTAAWVGLGLVAISLLTHLVVGHPPGSPEWMGPFEFLLQHPSFLAVTAAAIGVVLWLGRAG
jgi:hypothetical protein